MVVLLAGARFPESRSLTSAMSSELACIFKLICITCWSVFVGGFDDNNYNYVELRRKKISG